MSRYEVRRSRTRPPISYIAVALTNNKAAVRCCCSRSSDVIRLTDLNAPRLKSSSKAALATLADEQLVCARIELFDELGAIGERAVHLLATSANEARATTAWLAP